jgi:hypothetical protein
VNTQSNPTDDLIEALAELEHEQWMYWSQSVAAEVPALTKARWQRSWIAYPDLNNELKEADRVWAQKVANLLREWQLIP